MSSDTVSNMLIIVLGVMLFILIILVLIFAVLQIKERQKQKTTSNSMESKKGNKKQSKNTANSSNQYNVQSMIDFMDFEKLEDNMIIQKKGKRFLMVIECQGVNYDLMSNIEKVAVEEGFQQFLNTLRHPIQIYIQTRTINLESTINVYKDKVKEIEKQYSNMMMENSRRKNSETYSQTEMEKYTFELTKQKNLLEYGRDLIANIEKMSLNKNVLNKKYYIIIPYFAEEVSEEKYDYEEIKNIAFSELYTKSQAIIRTLSSSSVNGKILSSKELVELLYVAYNRDESETYGIDKAIRAGYDELYSTAPDVFEKKMKILDQKVEEEAIQLANKAIESVKSRNQRKAEEKEHNLDDLISKMAEVILSDNKEYVGGEIAEQAIEEIKNPKKGGEKTDEKIKKTTTRGRKKTTTI